MRAQNRVLKGLPTEAILETAESEQIEVNVMGTQGRRGITALLMGSVAEAVVSRAKCRVFVVQDVPKATWADGPAHPKRFAAARREATRRGSAYRVVRRSSRQSEFRALQVRRITEVLSIPSARLMPFKGAYHRKSQSEIGEEGRGAEGEAARDHETREIGEATGSS